MNEIYLAGGCFWGMEKVFRALDGVTETTVGYANGTTEHPTYEEVCTDKTGHRETVKVVYDPDHVSLRKILKAYFICIDPKLQNRQGNDIGSQYQTGIYTTDAESLKIVESYAAEEKKKHDCFYTEIMPLKQFWPAEEYHQNYLEKNPNGYCHITTREYELVKQLNQEGDDSE
ncbi:MAG: peptide-methionine (S)-S-oxide reductase MsrA [Solobacterium sp.]|nr:peptide-methionine (S)-S-oxide reductase MsrA [Solobacterium sp.]